MPNIKQKKQEMLELLKLHYGFTGFRPGQEQVIDNILEKKSTVVIMPTGGGKSLCFQLPALVLDGVTLVVSPLIALMKDQVDNLESIGIPATFINSSISPVETSTRLNAVKNKAYKLLYIAPERFYSKEFLNALKDIKVSLFAIDEAHCVSQWGHDFRPAYLRIKNAVELLGNPTVIALTATATPKVKSDIIKQLDLKNPEIVITGFARPNLQFGVIQAKEAQKSQLILDAITNAPNECGIIYASTRARVDNLLQFLLGNNIEAAGYHAGMDAEDRKWVQNNFLSGKIKIIVATNAFGMGIDKSDVRYVVHYDMPGTIESYYQEAGRAGRDGKQSFCLMLFNSRDRALHEFFIKGDNPPPNVIQEIYNLLLSYEPDSIFITYAELSDMLLDDIPDMAVGTSLKILEKEGYITRSREKNNNSYLKFSQNFSQIKNSIGTRAKKQLAAMEALEGKFADELLQGSELNLEEISDIINIKKETLLRLIRKLVENNLAEYRPPFKGTEIKILKKVDSRDLNIDASALKEKLRNAYKKLDKIEEYAYTSDCRQKFILDYFGEISSNACGKCDSCLSTGGYQRKHEATQKDCTPKKFKNKIETDFVVASPDKKSGLNTKLTQLETLGLHQKGLSIAEIALKRNLSEADVVSHLDFLKDKKIISE
ncbi:RecQ family ATP-dependent DNA helicase [Candidatus Parcubacteria bacterium]|nr:RecQ family ATP-dependent DNA helicase [Candidatus Parcubacteria bacterium]